MLSVTNQLERLTEAYLQGVIPLIEYQRRRQELEQKHQALATQEKQLEVQVDRHGQLAGMVHSIAAFCQRVQAGLAQATFAQKRTLVELLIDRVLVANGDVDIRYAIPTHPRGEMARFCQLRKDYFHDIVQIFYLADHNIGAMRPVIARDGRGMGLAAVDGDGLRDAMAAYRLRQKPQRRFQWGAVLDDPAVPQAHNRHCNAHLPRRSWAAAGLGRGHAVQYQPYAMDSYT